MKYAYPMRIVVIIVLAGLLSACGFQLRGANVLPEDLKNLYVQAPERLADDVRVFLDGTDTQVLRQPKGADVILTLSNPRYDRRVISVDPSTGKEREFELTYSLTYRAERTAGKTILNTGQLIIRRDYFFDRDAIIGKSREAGVLRTEMRRDAIRQVLFRLQSASG